MIALALVVVAVGLALGWSLTAPVRPGERRGLLVLVLAVLFSVGVLALVATGAYRLVRALTGR